jgi:hypothetical protein
MFRLINQILQLNEFYGISKEIDIVQGVNRYPDTIQDAFKQAKRKLMSNNEEEDSGI